MTLETVELKPGASLFERHMAALGNPPVGTDDDSGISDAELHVAGWKRAIEKYAH